ncbi:hypothetical protein KAT08_03490 [Candidatus Babeliales bacterium]|nr:hypothetical protein [Candidatus Babeliales bacterium]
MIKKLLSKNSIDLLRKCIENHNKELLYIIDLEKIVDIDPDLGNDLRDCVSDELIEHGFNGDEPNDYDIQLESLIDEIGRHYL